MSLDITKLPEWSAHGYKYFPPKNMSWKVKEMGEIIGASEGKPSQWIGVELTGGTIHGHPIALEEYLRLTK